MNGIVFSTHSNIHHCHRKACMESTDKRDDLNDVKRKINACIYIFVNRRTFDTFVLFGYQSMTHIYARAHTIWIMQDDQIANTQHWICMQCREHLAFCWLTVCSSWFHHVFIFYIQWARAEINIMPFINWFPFVSAHFSTLKKTTNISSSNKHHCVLPERRLENKYERIQSE